GLAFAVGILAFFLVLAGVNAGLRLTIGEALNVSDHFQFAPVRIALAMVLVAVAVYMFGAFTVTIPSRLAAAEGKMQREGHAKSFGMGLMMAILATPCSFGLLAAAMAWGQTQPWQVGTLVFVVMGLGMAAPHALLAAFPSLVNHLPKPGVWMEKLKIGMGFPVLLAAVYLLSTLSNNSYPYWVMAWGVLLAMGLWAWSSWVRYDAATWKKALVRGGAAAILVVTGLWMLTPPKPLAVQFEDFDMAQIEQAREAGQPVLLKFTASWCTECRILDAKVYNDEQLANTLRQRDVVTMKADVSERGSAADDLLKQRYGGAPPLTVIYPAGSGRPITLVGVYSEQELLEALDRASSPAVAARGE
ncbi:MAG: protein-disulfide reductase DsbD family protein, partial [Planctomycetota bacterium]